MIDLKRLRDDPAYRHGIERKRVRDSLLDEVLRLYESQRLAQSDVEQARARQNQASKEIGKASANERDEKIAQAEIWKAELKTGEAHLADVQQRLREVALQLPNPADASAPDGGEDDGDVVKIVGDTPAPPPQDHAAYSEAMGFVDTPRAA